MKLREESVFLIQADRNSPESNSNKMDSNKMNTDPDPDLELELISTNESESADLDLELDPTKDPNLNAASNSNNANSSGSGSDSSNSGSISPADLSMHESSPSFSGSYRAWHEDLENENDEFLLEDIEPEGEDGRMDTLDSGPPTPGRKGWKESLTSQEFKRPEGSFRRKLKKLSDFGVISEFIWDTIFFTSLKIVRVHVGFFEKSCINVSFKCHFRVYFAHFKNSLICRSNIATWKTSLQY